MKDKKIEDYKLKKMIEDMLNILENNFRYDYGKKIPYNEVFEIVKDLNVLFCNYEHNTKECGELVIKRFIPLLDLLIKIDTERTRMLNYEKYLKNAYKLGARISLEHYMVYREWDEIEKFFAPRYEIMKGYIHYLQEMTYNPKFHTLIFNAPSGMGKTYPEKVSEAWDFGIDPSGTILSLCSNEDVVKGGSRLVIDEIKSEWFGEVFPNLKWDKEDKDFFLKETENNWKLRDCKLSSSYIAKTTQSNVVGTRASKRIHIDDLYPNHFEALNQKTNYEYFNNYLTVWLKRFVQNKIAKCVITGTLWASGDFIALVIALMKKRYKFHPHPKYKYTLVNEDETVAIIQVPALDYVTGQSTCPDLRTTTQILEEKDSMDEYLFETNFQQKPTDPESLFFSYNKLRTYEVIPQTTYLGSYSVIDATRKSGKDFFGMPIFSKVPNENNFDYYLKDCLFTRTATKDMYEDVINKIIEHHIILLVIESNVSSELKQALDSRLKQRGIFYCEIIEKYNTIQKSTRIENEKGLIKRLLVFPQKGMYGPVSDIGLFMNNLTMYNNAGTNPNDDAPDCCALFCSEIIEENSSTQKAQAVPNIRKYF